jgi:hypothetical protein
MLNLGRTFTLVLMWVGMGRVKTTFSAKIIKMCFPPDQFGWEPGGRKSRLKNHSIIVSCMVLLCSTKICILTVFSLD